MGFEEMSTAIVMGDMNIVRRLSMNQAALLERSRETGQTPLHLAATNHEALKIILHSKVDGILRTLDFQGMNPIDYALQWSSRQCQNRSLWTSCSACTCTHSLGLLLSVDDCFGIWLANDDYSSFRSLLLSSHACRTRLLDELVNR